MSTRHLLWGLLLCIFSFADCKSNNAIHRENGCITNESRCWLGDWDFNTYKELEAALHQELDKPNPSSRSTDYMKSDAYKAYKTYLYKHPDCINLMFQGFLFAEPAAGLYGWLIDDIVQSRYPTAPSLQKIAAEVDGDNDAFVKSAYQKAIRKLMNQEKAE